ncbi:MAG: hypothetical protein WC312_02130 [Candidatus Omnitrophota bacterium]|jgi:hypothetical protein
MFEWEKDIDAVVYFYNLNDILVCPEIESRRKYIIDFQNIKLENVKRSRNSITKLLSKSNIYRLIENLLILSRETHLTVENYLDMYFNPINSDEFEKTIGFLVSMSNVAKERNVNFYVVIYPLLYKDIYGRYSFLQVHELLKNICEKHNIPCIDAYPAFANRYSLKKFTVHPIDYHPNRIANERVVEYLSKKDDFLQGYK